MGAPRFLRAGSQFGELYVSRPASRTPTPSMKLGPRGGAASRYGKGKVNAQMVRGMRLAKVKDRAILPAQQWPRHQWYCGEAG